MNRESTVKRKKKKQPKKVLIRLLIALVTFGLIFLILVATSVPKQHDLEVGQIAPSTIRAPRDVVDEYSTGILKEQARSNVSSSYTQDDNITAQVETEIDDFYLLLDAVREMGDIEKKRKQDLAGESASYVPYDTAFLDSMQEEMDSRFTKGEIQALLSLEQEEYVAVIDKAKTLILNSMNGGVKEVAVEDTILQLNQQILNPENKFSDNGQKVGMSIVSNMLRPNLLYDAQSTEAAR